MSMGPLRAIEFIPFNEILGQVKTLCDQAQKVCPQYRAEKRIERRDGTEVVVGLPLCTAVLKIRADLVTGAKMLSRLILYEHE